MFKLGKSQASTLAGLCALVLTGCTAQYIRDDAQEQLRAGHFEKALKTYDDGLARYPDSPILKSGQLNARDAVMARLVASVSAARAIGNEKDAEQLVLRAIAINPRDERIRSLLLDVERDKRQTAALAEAKDLIAKGMIERASLIVESSLKDNPRNAELLALQRKLELESRRQELSTTRLAETRPISLDFRDANLRTVLDVLTRSSGVNFVIDKDVRADLRTTVFLRQTKLEDALELLTSTSQLTYKVLDPATVLIYPKTPEKLKEYQDLVIRAFYLTSADVKQTAALLKSILKIREPFVDEKLNLIVVRETPETIRLAERLVGLHDVAEPEVMLEVEVLEVKSSRLTELGIKFPDSVSLSVLNPSGAAGGLTLGNISGVNSDRIGLALPNVLVNLRRDVGDLNILANPKIRARNREKAKIMIGDKLPVITTTANGTNFVSETVQYVDVGLKLDVEPTVHLDNEVIIKIGLEVSSLAREIRTSGGSLVYQIGTRNASTVLRLRDGETQLLAGLISNEERVNASRVPGIGDIPLIGRLFSSQRNDGQRTEIVLSVTPRIVHNIRRPDLNMAEFWSGSENNARSRTLLAASAVKLHEPARSPGPLAAAVAPQVQAPGEDPAMPPRLSLALNAPAAATVGETFSVSLDIDTNTAVRGTPLEFAFDPKVLQLLDVAEADFLKQGGAAVSITKNINQNAGRLAVAMLRNVTDGAKGKGSVVTLRFKALAAGASEIKLTSANLIGLQALPVTDLPKVAKVVVK